MLAAMGPPGGGRMVISKRLQSRFNLINMTFPQVYYTPSPNTSTGPTGPYERRVIYNNKKFKGAKEPF